MKKINIAEALETRQGKYFLEKRKGKNKTKAAIDAGYASGQNTNVIESSPTYKAVERYFRDVALETTTLNEIAETLVRNMRQDKDKGASNKAAEILLERVEPETAPPEREEAVMVVFKK